MIMTLSITFDIPKDDDASNPSHCSCRHALNDRVANSFVTHNRLYSVAIHKMLEPDLQLSRAFLFLIRSTRRRLHLLTALGPCTTAVSV